MEAQTALPRAARGVVMHAISRKGTHCAIIHSHRNGDNQRSFGIPEPFMQLPIETHFKSDFVQLTLRHEKVLCFALHRGSVNRL